MRERSLKIAAAAEHIREHRELIQTLAEEGLPTWKAMRALEWMEATLSELLIQRDALATAQRLNDLAPAPEQDNNPSSTA